MEKLEMFKDYVPFDEPICKTDLFTIRSGNSRMKQMRITYYNKKSTLQNADRNMEKEIQQEVKELEKYSMEITIIK